MANLSKTFGIAISDAGISISLQFHDYKKVKKKKQTFISFLFFYFF